MDGSTYAAFQGSGPRQRRNVAGLKVPAPTSVWYGCIRTQSRSAQNVSRARIMSWKLRVSGAGAPGSRVNRKEASARGATERRFQRPRRLARAAEVDQDLVRLVVRRSPER